MNTTLGCDINIKLVVKDRVTVLIKDGVELHGDAALTAIIFGGASRESYEYVRGTFEGASRAECIRQYEAAFSGVSCRALGDETFTWCGNGW